MNYVFFDTECSNCQNGIGKLCSFGYVKTDENFNIIKKKDILINPDSDFLLGNAKKGHGISLAYPLFKFRNSKTFPHFYTEIELILMDENNLIFGFSASQDINYLISTCKRYSKEVIKFNCFDIQLFEKNLHHLKNCTSLDKLIDTYHEKQYTYHRSDDDALMSMEVLIALLKESDLDINEMLKRYNNCFISTDTILLKKQMKSQKIKDKKKNSDLFSSFLDNSIDYNDIEHMDPFFYKKKFAFEKRLFNEKSDELLKYKKTINKKGGLIISSFNQADVIIISKKSNYPLLKGQIFISYNDFIKHFI